MTPHTFEVLEFFRIAEIIAGYCKSEQARERCLQKRPLQDAAEIAAAKELGRDILGFLQADEPLPIKNIPPLDSVLKQLHTAGVCLTVEELYAAGLLALQIDELKAWAAKQKKPESAACRLIESMPPLPQTEQAVFSFIDKNGALRDIPTLTAIQKKMRRIEADIEKTMRSYCTDESTKGMLQTPAPVLRNGRQVIAVRSNFKGRIKGIIHEYSQSGQSFYLEPESIVLRNNELMRAQAEYEQELHRLLLNISAKLAAEADPLERVYECVSELDCAAAAARWAYSENGVFVPDTGSSQYFYLQAARHPLLGAAAVPIDLKLAADERILIITGPNTGGKTVSLKTAALFVLLNQTGWPVLAGEDTRLPVFRYVGCAIGDEQSLERSLSTFSAYMRTVGGLLEAADEESLILLDELGSGTDPQEGGALAMAILDELFARRSRVFVTSHHGVLKNYAYRKRGCVNASVSFDEATLRPSYRILMGIPGESRAVDIAEKNGLPAEVIRAARAYMADSSADAAALIKGLMEKHEQLAVFEREKEEAEKALTEKQRRFDLNTLKLRQKELLLRSQGYKRLNDLFEQKRNEIENLVREIQEGELTHEKTSKLKQFFAGFEQTLAEEQTEIGNEQQELSGMEQALRNREQAHGKPANGMSATGVPASASTNEALTEGMEVLIPHLHRRGVIIRKEKKNWLVAVDTVKMTFPADKLEPLSPAAAPLRTPQVVVEAELHKESRPELELRLLGMRLDEAEKHLQNQLDLALMHNMQEFSIVHGKGNGVLQTMVQEKLAAAPYVAEFFFARPEHGGTGKTIVRLR
ncbi:Smr/MutS family protein [Treponema vincentii]|uniref:Endonuclease MutS2 n=1 Tax=Treponema vincentii ATCC 35580 TaxID=596324 RepID=C8PQ36_9SPIR|nr:Smr/MutS family protein [Treponema vincentii]EEV20518.1 recombination and DNA strand exchange inhibitor protein [Treponema vincentii ATCC 35580]UTC46974.1 endonuclease MutS2 [Treponema vincentii]UTC59805.1 Smr/MutS family protein [Treponema vincentii]